MHDDSLNAGTRYCSWPSMPSQQVSSQCLKEKGPLRPFLYIGSFNDLYGWRERCMFKRRHYFQSCHLQRYQIEQTDLQLMVQDFFEIVSVCGQISDGYAVVIQVIAAAHEQKTECR